MHPSFVSSLSLITVRFQRGSHHIVMLMLMLIFSIRGQWTHHAVRGRPPLAARSEIKMGSERVDSFHDLPCLYYSRTRCHISPCHLGAAHSGAVPRCQNV